MSQFSRTWWGRRFLAALEQCTDPARLGRGRSYARGNKVKEYALDGQTVRAKVRGSINPYFGVNKEPTYTTTVAFQPIPRDHWMRAIDTLSSKSGFVTRLLMNEMPDTIDEVFGAAGVHLLPHSEDDLITHCSCPDWSNPCKHVAGVCYLLAADLDRDPFLLFELRGLTRKELRSRLAGSPLGQILAAGLTPREVDIEPTESYFTEPQTRPPAQLNHYSFWMGSKRLPPFEPVARPGVPALLIKTQGDYPAFWQQDASFISTMEDVYDRVRTKSRQMK